MKANSCLHQALLGNNELNHMNDLKCIPGIWVGGKTYWLESSGEELNLDEGIFLHVENEQVENNINLLTAFVTNHSFCSLHAKLLFQYQQDSDDDQFSFISPSENIIYHVKDNRVHLINGHCFNNKKSSYSVQPFDNLFHNQIWRCRETGILKYNPMASGNVMSIQIFDLDLEEKQTLIGKSWIISGHNEETLLKLNEMLVKTH